MLTSQSNFSLPVALGPPYQADFSSPLSSDHSRTRYASNIARKPLPAVDKCIVLPALQVFHPTTAGIVPINRTASERLVPLITISPVTIHTTCLVPSHLKLLSVKSITNNTPNNATRYNPINATPSTSITHVFPVGSGSILISSALAILPANFKTLPGIEGMAEKLLRNILVALVPLLFVT